MSAAPKHGERRPLPDGGAQVFVRGQWVDSHDPRARDAGPRQSMLRTTLFSEISAEVLNKVWLVGGMFGAGELSAVYGFPGCGKSVLLGDGACHVAAGRPWFGRNITQGGVLYIAAERAGLVKRRFAAWRNRHGLDGLPLAVVEGAFNLCTSLECVSELVAIGKTIARDHECRIAWIIIDTKSRVMAGGDPNSDRDIQALVDSVARLQSDLDGPHVSIVDHVPYGSPERMKGSGALAGAVDASFLVRRDGAVRSLIVGSKPPNDGPDDVEILFSLESEVIGVSETGEETTAPVVVAASGGISQEQTKSRPLKPAAQRIKAAFARLIDSDRHCPAPSVPGVVPGTRAVTLADLRETAFSLGIFAEPEPPENDAAGRQRWRNGRNQAWKRGIEELVKARALRMELELVWDPTSRRAVTNGDENGDER